LHALASMGLRAARDVSVIGYDDLPMASYTDPPLTTLEQPISRMAQRLVHMLLALLDGAEPASFGEVWRARLIARQSDGSAPRMMQRAGKRRALGGHHAEDAGNIVRRDVPGPGGRGGTRR
jgi:LacI family transcriptional regulator